MVISVHHKRYAQLRSVLKQVRNTAGLTQVQLAEHLQIEQSNLSKIERGERYIDALLFIDYCKACGADPVEVISRLEGSTDLPR